MPYTVEEFLKEEWPKFLEKMTPEQRLRGLSAEEVLKALPPEERLKGLPHEEFLRALPVEEIEAYLKKVRSEQEPH